MRPKGTAQELERRRRRALELLQQGERVVDIARFLGIHTDTIYRWKAQVDRDGPNALDPKPQTGRPPKLNDDQLNQLDELLREGAKAHGYPDDLWSGQRVQDLIADHFGVDYHVDHVRKLLKHKLRYSSQKPEKKAYERDDWEFDFFRQEKFDMLLDHAQTHDQHLVFLDESGFQLVPNVRCGYAPLGDTPIFEYSNDNQRISVISCVTLSPCFSNTELYFRLLDPNENARALDIVDFLSQLQESLPRMLIVWDGASIHARSLLVREFLDTQEGIEEETLPAYSPQLNPDEYVWSYLKHSRMYHFAPTNVIDLYDRLEEELWELSDKQAILRGFINHSQLPFRI